MTATADVRPPVATTDTDRADTRQADTARAHADRAGADNDRAEAVWTSPTGNLAFGHRDGFVAGAGSFERLTVTGADAAEQISAWFADIAARRPADVAAADLIAFVSLGFSPTDPSVAVVPAVVTGRLRGRDFTTRLGRSPGPAAAVTAPGRVRYADASLSVAGFTAAVRAARERVRAGDLRKVVLAHDLEAVAEHEVDERHLLRRLAAAYPGCATFAVDGLVGASPEMLVRRRGRSVSSRVLAGTAWVERPGDRPGDDLLVSAKNRSEHAIAVASVAATLDRLCDELDVPAAPHPLVLANLTHLATDVVGRLAEPAPTALQIAGALHPTAAVGGTPTTRALALISELEPSPRGRYAAPVGWMNAAGDGEFAIALRCGQVSGRSVRLLAGCGIVADSDPEVEAREAQVKMLPIREALEN